MLILFSKLFLKLKNRERKSATNFRFSRGWKTNGPLIHAFVSCLIKIPEGVKWELEIAIFAREMEFLYGSEIHWPKAIANRYGLRFGQDVQQDYGICAFGHSTLFILDQGLVCIIAG